MAEIENITQVKTDSFGAASVPTESYLRKGNGKFVGEVAPAENNQDMLQPEPVPDNRMELKKKRAEIARKFEKLPLQARMNIIAEAFGCKTARIETIPCTGMKWRGTSDVRLVFDNGAALSIGNDRTPRTKTKKLQSELVNSTLLQYNEEILRECKARAAAVLVKREAKDNAVAAEKGLKPYTFLTVEMNDGSDRDSGGYIGWFYVTLAVDGKITVHLETGLNYDIHSGDLSEEISRRNYFVAGALKEDEVDYVFDNVGFSTARLYSLPLTDAVRERAEKKLAEIRAGAPERLGDM